MMREQILEIDVDFRGRSIDPPDVKRVSVVVAIDVEAIAKALGSKAHRSKSGKAVEVGGLVRVRAIR